MRWLLPEGQQMKKNNDLYRFVEWPGVDDEPPAYYITQDDRIIAEVYDETIGSQIVFELNCAEDERRQLRELLD